VNSIPSSIGFSTPVIVFANGEKWEVPFMELDKEDRQRIRHILDVLDAEAK